ncbi:DUF1715 domain-containing protein [Drepanopeziza brunnea f. sp. 'multigermtubi' MB_m1]|uniref:DUF1715 domain-containing protein n=1 Tax=Marssonina brunnea f. sp. multigermtubi (strain MB_m1) TaxID=1072389 RepID=K1WLY3_MARBU|nr:DUF1715 domain-containing protein [Drepanopeziza brunnea f. sp. 'multigermtubi' MB_m1]EKD13901.1 DUF1715 domain-containing protein [Drepanopeziza brunnea f. sp. 'multigermtubi' MB_m1]
MYSDSFDEVLGLEEQFYNAGFQQGMVDGVKAGRIEGRTFGLEKGFEKYMESGKLYGKSIIWANRIPRLEKDNLKEDGSAPQFGGQATSFPLGGRQTHPRSLDPLPANHRLENHVKVLHALAESESLSTENTEDAVSDFDDRLKRAQGKAKIIEKISGERNPGTGNDVPETRNTSNV